MTQISQALPVRGSPLFAGGDLNYHVPAPTPEEHECAQLVRSFLAERSSICVEFPFPTHRPTEQHASNARQLDAFSVPASAIWKWSVTPCWTDGQSDHAAIIVSPRRRRTSDSGGLSAHLVKCLPPIALADLRSRFGLLERLFDILGRGHSAARQHNSFVRPLDPGLAPMDAVHPESGEEADTNQGPSSRNELGHSSNTNSESNNLNRSSGQPPPLVLGLLLHGGAAMEAMIQGWWRTWRHDKPASVGALLQGIEHGRSAIRPTGVLRDLIQAQG